MIYAAFICKTVEKHIALSEHATLLHLIQGAMARQRGIIHKHLINGKVYWTEYMYIIIGTMWSQLSQCSQLSQSTNIVATPITIVAKNHNCRKNPQLLQLQPQLSQSDQPQLSQLQPQLLQFFRKNFDLVNIYTWLKDDVSLSLLNLDSIFHNYCCYFALLTCYNIYL